MLMLKNYIFGFLGNNPRSSSVFFQGNIVYEIFYTNKTDKHELLSLLYMPILQRVKMNSSDIPASFALKKEEYVTKKELDKISTELKISVFEAFKQNYINEAEKLKLEVYYLMLEDEDTSKQLKTRLLTENESLRIEYYKNVLIVFSKKDM